MYLEKLEIQGFKSFANKNLLVFPGMMGGGKRGITSVVGPNGSGKSNVADAVRWALGEQSMKTLRGKKSEDVIFSGSDKKGKLGMAEVSLFLNNEDGQAPIDYSEIVITRRLYRNGDSEYMLNGNKVRLSDIQMLLAKSKFGQKTYSVIGQGMVEGFLNTSLSERKEFFDEATGVRQYQIKRDESLNKLKSSYENMSQAQMLLSEIEPRLKSLTRQVGRLEKRGEIESELRGLQKKYYCKVWREIHGKFTESNDKFLELEKVKLQKDKKRENLSRELEKMEEESMDNTEYIEAQKKLSSLRHRREELNREIARLDTRMELKLESAGKFDLSFLFGKKEEIKKRMEEIEKEISAVDEKINDRKKKEEEIGKQKMEIENEINVLNKELETVQNRFSGDTGEMHAKLVRLHEKIRTVDDSAGIDGLKKTLKEIEDEIYSIISAFDPGSFPEVRGEGEKEWKDIHGSIREQIEKKDGLSSKISATSAELSSYIERKKLFTGEAEKLSGELNGIESKISQYDSSMGNDEVMEKIRGEKEKLASALSEADSEIAVIKGIIQNKEEEERGRKGRLFTLQRDMQGIQDEINNLSNRLNEYKINSTRHETRLEDLEVEIREELGGLKEVREAKEDDAVDVQEATGRIKSLKHQLELIGGIDPQVEKEYAETKERFDYLSGQANDLVEAIGSLEKIIKELDMNIRERFDKEFRIIAKKFEEYFKILFNGGTAKIIKVMENAMGEEEAYEGKEDEEGESAPKKKEDEAVDMKKIKFLQKHNATGLAGIEIQATPPGKKIKSISMLSGGERALTAIALICAIISANPSPFVVLDEVDAALDEANSERLARILDELSHKTQFIAITHNRATMRRANVLYGITMGDDGVSKLLSVKLDEAEKM